jgi:hypothetical protein
MKTSLQTTVLVSLFALATSVLAAPSAPAAAQDSLSQPPSAEVMELARWIKDSGDNMRLPFLLVDKVSAQVHVFDADGKLRGSAPALLGLARGDRLLAPNGATLKQMRPFERITPAGRFVSRLSIDDEGKELLVMDYAAAISLHPVIKGTPEERRAERLGSPTAQDNRISYGCINVPTAFYSNSVRPTFAGTRGVVYVLPEMGSASALFGMRPASAIASRATASAQVRSAP